MSTRELQEWAQYDRISPFGDKRADFRAIFIAWVIYSMNQPSKRHGGKPMSLDEFRDEYWPDWLATEEELRERREARVKSKIKSIFSGQPGAR